jgi:ferritin-like metal-binding protein YciE
MARDDKLAKAGQKKLTRYLEEARAMELALVQTLTAHIAVTPRSDYRVQLERHLEQTRGHAERLSRRLDGLGEGSNPVAAGLGAIQAAAGQVIAAAKAPLDLLRGAGAAEKLLKNAKDESTAEQLEISTYTSIRRLAEAIGDPVTARLASSIRQDERRMLTILNQQVETLTAAVVRQDIRGEKVFDLTTVGAADAVRRIAARGKGATDAVILEAQEAAREARDDVGQTATTARREAAGTARSAKRSATTTARAARHEVKRTAGQARGGARRTARTAASSARGTSTTARKGAQRTARRARTAAGSAA